MRRLKRMSYRESDEKVMLGDTLESVISTFINEAIEKAGTLALLE